MKLTEEEALEIARRVYEKIGPHLTRAQWLAEAVAKEVWRAAIEKEAQRG